MLSHLSDPGLLTAALDAIPLGILITDSHGIIVWANSHLAGLTGYQVAELAGQSAAILELPTETPGLVPGDLVFCRRRTGEHFPATQTVKAIQSGIFMITLQQLSGESRKAAEARRQMHEHYQLISENTVDVIWLWNLGEDRCVFASPSVQRLRGFTPDEVLGQSMAQAMSPDSLGLVAAQLAKCVAAVEAGDESSRIRRNELKFTCKDGSTVTTETVTKLLSGEQGKVQFVLGVTRDITERIVAQQALEKAEEKYRKIFDGAMEGVYRTSVSGRPLDVNPALAKMLGFDSAEHLIASVADVGQQSWVDPAEHARFEKLIAEHGTVRGFECRQKRADGRIIWVSVNSRRVMGPGGEALYHEGFMEDITERKRMEDALRQSEERFLRVFLSSPTSISIHDMHDQGRILDVNEAFEQVTGFPRKEAIGRTNNDLNLLIDSSTEPEIIRQLSTEGRIRNLEHLFRTRGGDIRTGALYAERIEIDGKLCAVVSNIDITERKHAEERIESLATAIEQAGEQIVLTSLDGTIEYCNPAFEKTTGYSKAEVLGQNPRVLKSGKQSSAFYGELWQTISSGSVWTGRFTNRKKDGSLYEEDSTISPIRDATGKIKGYVAIKRDVSERIQLENQFRQSQKLESVGRLAGGIAHDFNNLLTVINGYSGLLTEQLTRYDPLWPYADEISKAGDRAAGLTRQLLAFSRKQVIELKTLDLNVILRDAERMLRRLIGDDVELITILAPAPGGVMGDLDQIHQVIMNLVVNARDAMPDGGTIVLETKAVDLLEAAAGAHPDRVPGQYVVMSVTDTGVGMDEQILERIYEPFFTTKEQGKGTGLGLSTVYGIVRQNGGWVEVSSQVGHGTTFRIYLPRIDAAPSVAEKASAVIPAKPSGKTVLLVEDQEEVRKLAKTILKKHGYQILEARSGAEAYVLANEFPGDIDLLLTDVVMPGMNGKELSDLLTTQRPTVRVLFSSGYTADVIAQRGVLERHVAYLPKPYSAEALVNKVREILLD